MLPNNFTVAKVLTPIHCVAGLCFQLHWGFGCIGHQVKWILDMLDLICKTGDVRGERST